MTDENFADGLEELKSEMSDLENNDGFEISNENVIDRRLELYRQTDESTEDEAPKASRKSLDIKEVNIPIVLTHKNAVVPERKTLGAAADDVYAVNDVILEPGKTTAVDLGFKIAIPQAYEVIVVPRSGLSTKGVAVKNSPGTIDSDYRGQVKVLLQYNPENLCQAVSKCYKVLFEFAKNMQSANAFETARSRLMDHVKNDPFEPYVIKAGDRIGQIKVCRVITHAFNEVDFLDETDRADGGFGSTGR